jgi:hypothetical protein
MTESKCSFLLCKHLVQLWLKPPTRFFHTVVRQGTAPFIKSEHLKLKPPEELRALGYQLHHHTRIVAVPSADTPFDADDGHDLFSDHDNAPAIFDGDGLLEDEDDAEAEAEDERVEAERIELRNARVAAALGELSGDVETEAEGALRRADARAKLEGVTNELDELSRRFRSQLQFASARFADDAAAKTATARRYNADLANLDNAMTSTDVDRPQTWAGPSGTMYYRPAQYVT